MTRKTIKTVTPTTIIIWKMRKKNRHRNRCWEHFQLQQGDLNHKVSRNKKIFYGRFSDQKHTKGINHTLFKKKIFF